jgi:hypothetical protein
MGAFRSMALAGGMVVRIAAVSSAVRKRRDIEISK